MENKFLKLNPGREKSLLRRHVWIFSGAVADYPGEAAPGETVEVFDSKNNFLARAAYSPDSQLIARVWTFDRDEQIDEAFFARRIKAAVEYRHFLKLDDPKGGCRLINSEADGLPGLVVDRYAGVLVIQITSAGIEFHRDTIVKLLAEITGAASIYERSDVSVRAKEGLAERSGLLYGAQPPNPVIIEENGARFAVDVRHGQKSGFYFDQRCARAAVAAYADGRTVLNAFSYTGAFAVSALLAGAGHVINIDSSAPALKQAAHNLEMNKIKPERYENRTADVFTELRRLVEEGRKFDLVILDPPKFIESQKALVRGCRAYQDIARLGYRLLNPGGLLFNFSCSGLMTPELFQKITADAALDAGVRARLVRHLEQALDHPVSLAVPEGFYLKGLVTRIDAE
ncbi:class I SAM-dependent methyltransferase [uncultured Victivallis sp.]|uniref:class I SAM-dependent rRNA methyltransferase n=1 Tax=uncultured Victivallis sp. TaxID=354118 RepID=UPI00258977AE|nr:class I SAM-dependent methyltransferase [uncultured Victivallis sp.]